MVFISYVNGKYSYYKNNDYLIIKIIRLIKSNLILTLIYLIDKFILYISYSYHLEEKRFFS